MASKCGWTPKHLLLTEENIWFRGSDGRHQPLPPPTPTATHTHTHTPRVMRPGHAAHSREVSGGRRAARVSSTSSKAHVGLSGLEDGLARLPACHGSLWILSERSSRMLADAKKKKKKNMRTWRVPPAPPPGPGATLERGFRKMPGDVRMARRICSSGRHTRRSSGDHRPDETRPFRQREGCCWIGGKF